PVVASAGSRGAAATPAPPGRPPGLRRFAPARPGETHAFAATRTTESAESLGAPNLDVCTIQGCGPDITSRFSSVQVLNERLGHFEVVATLYNFAAARRGVYLPLGSIGWKTLPAQPAATGSSAPSARVVEPALCGSDETLVVTVRDLARRAVTVGTLPVPAGAPGDQPIEVLASGLFGTAGPDHVAIVVTRTAPSVTSVRASWQGVSSAGAPAHGWTVLVAPEPLVLGPASPVTVAALGPGGKVLESAKVADGGVLYLVPLACPAYHPPSSVVGSR
ncbi:MAG: hypothetical protein ACRD0B_10170, partial [Acidimicrobiales bacterium]